MAFSDVSTTVFFIRLARCLVTVMAASIPIVAEAQQTQSGATSPATQSRLSIAPPSIEESESTLRLFMPDGQIKSHPIRVYVTRDILASQNPQLRLLRSHAVTKKAADGANFNEPVVVAPNQEWIESIEGQQVRRSGTLLLFDLSNMNFKYKAMLRVMPVVSWTEGDTNRVAVGAREVNIGNIVAAIFWTVLVVGLAFLAVIVLSWLKGNDPFLLLTGVDGHLSLAQTQIACWTVAVGSVVIGYGFMRLEVPSIPTSILALMGASLATGGIGYFQDARNQQASRELGRTPVHRTWAIADLVCVFPTGQAVELSLAKAQMLFWTVLLLVLFVSKSILDGAIWEVPWELVALMGFSQAGYLAPKLASQPSGGNRSRPDVSTQAAADAVVAGDSGSSDGAER